MTSSSSLGSVIEFTSDFIHTGLSLLPKEKRLVKLNKACTKPVLLHDGSYRNLPFMGVESFTVESAYLGKRNQIIYRLSQLSLDRSSFKYLEIPGKEMDSLFTGFRGVRSLAVEAANGKLTAPSEEVDELTAPSEEVGASSYGTSWGTFA